MKKLILLSACILTLLSCKKADGPIVYKTLTIAITGVIANSTYDIQCTDPDDKDAAGKQKIIFEVKAGTENKTYTTQVHSTQRVGISIDKSANRGAITTLSVDGQVLGNIESSVSSGGILVTIP